VQSVESTRVRNHRSTGTPGLPCAMVLTAYTALSPVTGLSCHRHRRLPANLTPASGRQDHTTSPYAPASFVCVSQAEDPIAPMLPRPPLPAPTFLTMANAPLSGRDARMCRDDLPDGESEIFLREGLDRLMGDLPVGHNQQPVRQQDCGADCTRTRKNAARCG